VKKGKKKKEFSGGFRLTTNNRMELLACIAGLSQLKNPSRVTIYSDSKYVVYGIDKGWAKRWRANNWMRTKEEPAINPDLWGQLLDLCNKHEVKFIWVKGHAGNPENERCDRLATQAASRRNLSTDRVYEGKKYKRYGRS
jgi:ribonuclease HI